MKKGFVKTLAIGIAAIAVIAIVCFAAFASSETNFAAAPADDTAAEVVLEQEVNEEDTEETEEAVVEEEEETEAPAAQTQQAPAAQTQQTSAAQTQRSGNTQRTNNSNAAAQTQQAPAAQTQQASEPAEPAAETQAPAPAAETPAPETQAPVPETQAPAPAGPVPTYSDVPFVGVLHIPSAGIHVDLYASASQSVTDRQNSANCFSVGFFPGKIIADHSSQAFSSLTSVHGGTSGYIEYANGSVRNISCATAFTGHNTDYELTDDNYNVIPGGSFALYTCMGSWQNVYIAIFN